VVDIRIAAKAKNETEADEMIASIEEEIRARLGDVVFGVDEDKLEEVTLNEVAKRGWTLTAIESGLDGLLALKIPHAVAITDLSPAALMDTLRAARVETNADVALGVVLLPEARAAEIALITTTGEKSHHISYGGPPRSLPRWSVNLALDWLRRRAMDQEGN
jgi:hypothetical protein